MRKIKELLAHKELRLYLNNTSWIIGEKLLQLLLSFFVSILVARYLGPTNYGTLAYAISLVGLMKAINEIGLSGLVTRDLVKYPEERGITLGTVSLIKIIVGLLSFLILVFILFISEPISSKNFQILFIVSFSLLLNPFVVFEFWFQANVQARYSSLAHGLSYITASILRLILVLCKADIVVFAYVYIIEATISSIFLFIFYTLKASLSLKKWHVNLEKGKELLKQGWVIALGGLFASVYLRIDKIMLRWMVNPEEVGIYAVAAQLSEVWYFIPTAIVTSLFPKLIQLKESNTKEYLRRFQQLFDLLFLLALFLVILVSLFSQPVISILYGQSYERSSSVLIIHIWAGLFIFMRAGFSKWILIENALIFSTITTGFGALINVGLNFLLIPNFRSYGAAIATLISYAFASYISLAFYKKSRPVFFMMTRSIASPYRYLVQFFLKKKFYE